jgi:LruC domain-containing protein
MKTTYPKLSLVLFSIFSLFLHSCVDENVPNNELTTNNFDFKTTKELKVSVSTLNSENKPVGGAFVQIYTQNPLTSEGLLKENSNDFLVFKGISSNAGLLECQIAPQTSVDSLSVLVNHIGLPAFKQVKIDSKNLNIVIGGATSTSSNKMRANSKTAADLPEPVKVSDYYVLGSWDNLGKPNYLSNLPDKISNDFLSKVNASLPERKKLTETHPEYLSATDNGNIQLIADAEVWITFVHEGAGNINALGYYTHKNDNPPASTNNINDKTIVFPNVSYRGSAGGALTSGIKVQLLYLDPTTKKYSTIFPAGTTVAWFFVVNSFNKTTTSIGSGQVTYFSDARFNPEKNVDKRKHSVILKDTERKILLIGFEDLNHEYGGDEDFNDGVFYSTVTPFNAVKTDNMQSITTMKDTDGDGVEDRIDEFPNDATKAFNNFSAYNNNVGTLAFEDLWPIKGDYDFNDLVVDYNFNQVTNADNKVVEINAELTVRAIGATLRNAFALQFNTTPANVKSVTGQRLSGRVFALNANGTEQKQSKAVVPIFDDPFILLNDTDSSIITNTYEGQFSEPKTLNVKIEFITPIALSDFGTAPYNPFLVAGGIRGKEIHLPSNEPTDLADKSKFGTGDDDSYLAFKKYYMSDTNLPWAINIPVQFAYPLEKRDITRAYLKFNEWALSKGTQYMDWYVDKAGYRDNSKIYTKK